MISTDDKKRLLSDSSMHPGRPTASGSGGMSTEQLQRMEANRRRAQAKLTAKRVAPPHTGVQGPPPAKNTLTLRLQLLPQRWRLHSLVQVPMTMLDLILILLKLAQVPVQEIKYKNQDRLIL